MQKFLAVTIGIIVARTKVGGPWQSHEWQPVSAVIGGLQLKSGSLLRTDHETAYFFAGDAMLNLHAAEVASYRINIEQHAPQIYVVLEPRAGPHLHPPTVHLVTAAPDEAESYLEGDDWLMDSIGMPATLLDAVRAFVSAHETGPAAAHDRPQRAPALSEEWILGCERQQ
jgi:hypothetical protein